MDRVTLLNILQQRHNESEVHTIAFDLGVDWDDLAGRVWKERARELLLHCERHSKYQALVTRVLQRADLQREFGNQQSGGYVSQQPVYGSQQIPAQPVYNSGESWALRQLPDGTLDQLNAIARVRGEVAGRAYTLDRFFTVLDQLLSEIQQDYLRRLRGSSFGKSGIQPIRGMDAQLPRTDLPQLFVLLSQYLSSSDVQAGYLPVEVRTCLLTMLQEFPKYGDALLLQDQYVQGFAQEYDLSGAIQTISSLEAAIKQVVTPLQALR